MNSGDQNKKPTEAIKLNCIATPPSKLILPQLNATNSSINVSLKDIDDEIEYLSDHNSHNKNKKVRLLKDEEFIQARVIVILGQKDWISAVAGTVRTLSQIYNYI